VSASPSPASSGRADAVVVGAGPNGLAAALTLARAGLAVEVYEGGRHPGGGCVTAEMTLPGFSHDVCAAVHPLLAASPFFKRSALPGVELLASPVAFAHPLDGGRAVAATRSLPETAASLGTDERAYRRLLEPLVEDAEAVTDAVLAPLLAAPRHPLALARFGLRALWPVSMLARSLRTEGARALLAGLGAHSMQPLSAPGTGAFALLLGTLAHSVGWPVVRGGSGRIIDAMLDELRAAGAPVHTERRVGDLDELPRARATLLGVTPRGLLALAGGRLPPRYGRALRRFRYGPGVCKVDWALDGPVPWQADECRRAPTVHVGGTFEEVARSEADVARGRHSERPFCIAVQAGVLDRSRAPEGRETFYAYCHVPAGSDVDMTERIEAQVERFAPGFRDRVLSRRTITAAAMERHNPNYVGGDINAGAASLRQAVARPVASRNPYRTPIPGVYLCSSSTPPGGGVHGMCGHAAALTALHDMRL
jgi:phytoene dehydrogenase-like protein